MGLYYRIGMVVILAVVIVVVVVLKTGRPRVLESEGTVAVDTLATGPIEGDTVAQEPETVETGTAAVERSAVLPKNVLAIVNGKEVTLAALNREFDGLPPQAKDFFKEDKASFLEEIILKQLLLQDAKRKGVAEKPEFEAAVARNPGQEEQIMINMLRRGLVDGVAVTEPELREFFEQYEDQLPIKDFDAIKEQLRPMALEEKQRVVIEDYVNQLKSDADIVRNDQWIKAQEALTADNPLSRALKSGRPVVADFGRGTCVPCKMMEPILKKLQQDYEGRAEILILDIGEYAALSRKYRVMMIPTQIFFDEQGKEIGRHQGFMSEADLVAQLKKMGVE